MKHVITLDAKVFAEGKVYILLEDLIAYLRRVGEDSAADKLERGQVVNS